jgi:hypothetical protein
MVNSRGEIADKVACRDRFHNDVGERALGDHQRCAVCGGGELWRSFFGGVWRIFGGV